MTSANPLCHLTARRAFRLQGLARSRLYVSVIAALALIPQPLCARVEDVLLLREGKGDQLLGETAASQRLLQQAQPPKPATCIADCEPLGDGSISSPLLARVSGSGSTTVTPVATAQALREAVAAGDNHIELQQHVDLTNVGQPESNSTTTVSPKLPAVQGSTWSIRVRFNRLNSTIMAYAWYHLRSCRL
jgi:hypothetical protein